MKKINLFFILFVLQISVGDASDESGCMAPTEPKLLDPMFATLAPEVKKVACNAEVVIPGISNSKFIVDHNKLRCSEVDICAESVLINNDDTKTAKALLDEYLPKAILLGVMDQEIHKKIKYNTLLKRYENKNKLKVCDIEKIETSCEKDIRNALSSVSGSFIDHPTLDIGPTSDVSTEDYFFKKFFPDNIYKTVSLTEEELRSKCDNKISFNTICSERDERLKVFTECDKNPSSKGCLDQEQNALASLLNSRKDDRAVFLSMEKQLCSNSRLVQDVSAKMIAQGKKSIIATVKNIKSSISELGLKGNAIPLGKLSNNPAVAAPGLKVKLDKLEKLETSVKQTANDKVDYSLATAKSNSADAELSAGISNIKEPKSEEALAGNTDGSRNMIQDPIESIPSGNTHIDSTDKIVPEHFANNQYNYPTNDSFTPIVDVGTNQISNVRNISNKSEKNLGTEEKNDEIQNAQVKKLKEELEAMEARMKKLSVSKDDAEKTELENKINKIKKEKEVLEEQIKRLAESKIRDGNKQEPGSTRNYEKRSTSFDTSVPPTSGWRPETSNSRTSPSELAINYNPIPASVPVQSTPGEIVRAIPIPTFHLNEHASRTDIRDLLKRLPSGTLATALIVLGDKQIIPKLIGGEVQLDEEGNVIYEIKDREDKNLLSLAPADLKIIDNKAGRKYTLEELNKETRKAFK